jgi:hypothetical protein
MRENHASKVDAGAQLRKSPSAGLFVEPQIFNHIIRFAGFTLVPAGTPEISPAHGAGFIATN